MRMTLRSVSLALRARSVASSHTCMMCLASTRRDFPAAVSVRPWCVRLNRVTPRFDSSMFICLITAVGDM